MSSSLRAECERIQLCPGDMIVDTTCNNVGILVDCVRRISIQKDDVYFWTIHWMREAYTESTTPMTIQMEEEGLKISIVVGLYDLFASDDADI
jgi:hypothetical protein